MSKIRAVTDIASMLSMLAASVMLWHMLISGRNAAGNRRAEGHGSSKTTGGLKVGVQVPPISGIEYSAARVTVLLFLNSRCDACVESLPDYTSFETRSTQSQVFALFVSETTAEVENFRRLGLGLPIKHLASFRAYHISATPTILMLNRQGIVLEYWVGRLSRRAKERIVKELSNSTEGNTTQ